MSLGPTGNPLVKAQLALADVHAAVAERTDHMKSGASDAVTLGEINQKMEKVRGALSELSNALSDLNEEVEMHADAKLVALQSKMLGELTHLETQWEGVAKDIDQMPRLGFFARIMGGDGQGELDAREKGLNTIFQKCIKPHQQNEALNRIDPQAKAALQKQFTKAAEPIDVKPSSTKCSTYVEGYMEESKTNVGFKQKLNKTYDGVVIPSATLKDLNRATFKVNGKVVVTEGATADGLKGEDVLGEALSKALLSAGADTDKASLAMMFANQAFTATAAIELTGVAAPLVAPEAPLFGSYGEPVYNISINDEGQPSVTSTWPALCRLASPERTLHPLPVAKVDVELTVNLDSGACTMSQQWKPMTA